MRSGYSEDCDGWELIMWRGAVASAIRGKRGQAFLHKLLAALDALPEKRLVAEKLQTHDGEVCALGSVGKLKGIDMTHLDPENHEQLAGVFDISPALVKEVEFINDDFGYRDTPEQRYSCVRKWAEQNLVATVGEKE